MAIGVHGPSAARDDPERDRDTRSSGSPRSTTTSRPESVTIVRDDALGLPGYDVYVPAGGGDAMRAKLVEAGAVTASEETGETLAHRGRDVRASAST